MQPPSPPTNIGWLSTIQLSGFSGPIAKRSAKTPRPGLVCGLSIGGDRVRTLAGIAPKLERLLRNGREVRLAPVGVNGHHFLTSVTAVNLVETFAIDLERLGE